MRPGNEQDGERARMIAGRKALSIVVLWIPAAIILVTWLSWQDRLPSALPTHWGTHGPADAVTSAPAFFTTMLSIAGTAALAGTVLILLRLTGRWVQRAWGGGTAAVAAFALGIWLGSTVPTLDVSDPYTVELGAWFLVTMVSPAYGLIPLLLLPRGEAAPVHPEKTLPVIPLDLTPTQSVAWSRTLFSWMFAAVSVLVIALAAASFVPPIVQHGFSAASWPLIPCILGILLATVFCAYRVSVDWRGLRVTSLLLGIPLRRIAPADIVAVEAADLDPLQWGGWGFRIMPGRSALILRRGPGLVVTTRKGTQFALTLDRPEEPASVLLHLINTEQHTPQ